MRHTVDPSTGVRVIVWRQEQLFHAAREGAAETPQICLGVDLFEVIAELAGLNLERPIEAEEASRLAVEAQQLLPTPVTAGEPQMASEHDLEQTT